MKIKRNILVCLLALFTIAHCGTIKNNLPKKQLECNLPQDVIDDIASYAEVTNRIIDYFTTGPLKGETWRRISDFVDKFGSRISGSQVLEDSIDYIIKESEDNGLENIRTHDVEVPHWVRGEESATLIKPRIKNLPILGLGTTISTPPEGITGSVVVVESFDDLNALSQDQVQGKIVVYNQPFITYGQSSSYRSRGASEAAKKGAIAALVRSVTSFSIATPHTGHQRYEANVTKIPVAAISVEDAEMLWRMQKRNEEIEISLKLSSTEDTKISRNFITDLKGSENEEKVVIISGHIDSWDVGDGSMDDAGGCYISWMAPLALKQLDLRPRRTLRTIMWTSEEFGYIGAEAYERDHRDENDNLNFVMESDFGTFAPLGLDYGGSETGACMMQEILKLFSSLNATELLLSPNPGSDITVFTSRGIPGGSLHNANDKYFWFHHTEGDTLTVLDSEVMDMNSAFWTAISYIIADMKSDIPRSDE